jgi:hypothetical protein
MEVVLAFHNVTRMKPESQAHQPRAICFRVGAPEAETLAALLPVAR